MAATLYGVVLLCVCALLGWVIITRYPQVNIMLRGGTEQGNDIIVVGGGLAGISAAIEATRHGSKVTIIEKEKNLGGNSAKATSGINGVGTEGQKLKEIEDSVDEFVHDILRSGDGLSNPQLVRTLARDSGSAIEFLRTFNLQLTDVVQLGGHSAPRTHRFPPTAEGKPVPVGFTILNTLKKYLASDDVKDKVTILTNTHFLGLVTDEGKVTGVKYRTEEEEVLQLSGVVILTAGGYGNDHTDTSLLAKHVPHLASYPTTNGPWATGDVLKATSDLGLSLIHMDKVQVHPTGFVDSKDPKFHTKFLAPEALRGCGAVLLDESGKRFVNELGRRDHVTEEITSRCKPFQGVDGNPLTATMLLTQEMIDKFSAPAAGFYIFKGLIRDVKTLQGAAELLEIPLETLEKTLEDYAKSAEDGEDEFGKVVFPTVPKKDDHFYVAFITPTLHYCMGGIQINTKAEVQRVISAGSGSETKVTSLLGVYAAGEVTGGVHGNNRLGGNSLLECVVFGRTAAFHAAHYKP